MYNIITIDNGFSVTFPSDSNLLTDALVWFDNKGNYEPIGFIKEININLSDKGFVKEITIYDTRTLDNPEIKYKDRFDIFCETLKQNDFFVKFEKLPSVLFDVEIKNNNLDWTEFDDDIAKIKASEDFLELKKAGLFHQSIDNIVNED